MVVVSEELNLRGSLLGNEMTHSSDLAGAIEEQVCALIQFSNLSLEPVDVADEVVHAVHETTIGSELALLHHPL